MYPQSPLPRHITALYLVAVVSLVVLCHAALAGADVLVFSQKTHEPVEDMEFPDLPARFGDRLPFEGIRGLVVYASPPSGCPDMQVPPTNISYTGKWIALIRRYDCNFEDKVRSAQRNGYDAVIIHNVNSSDLEPMSAKDPGDIFIPSVFVGEDAGLAIRDNFQYTSGSVLPGGHERVGADWWLISSYYILINEDLPFNINTHLLLPFAIVVGVCFLITVVFMVVKCVKDYRRQRRHRLPSSALRQIPTSKFTKGDPYETCAICLEDYLVGDKLRILPCSHAYHTKCIDPWLTRSRRVCPVCKRKVFAQNERVLSDTESETEDENAPLVRSPSAPGVAGGGGGGTFARQRDNPFRRAMRRRLERVQQRLDDSSSLSSGDAEAATITVEQQPQEEEHDDENQEQDEVQPSTSSAEHSINSEPAEEVPVEVEVVEAEVAGEEERLVPTPPRGTVVEVTLENSREPSSRDDSRRSDVIV